MLIRLMQLLKASVHINLPERSLLTLLSYFIGLFHVAAKPVKMQSQDFIQTLDYYLPPISFRLIEGEVLLHGEREILNDLGAIEQSPDPVSPSPQSP